MIKQQIRIGARGSKLSVAQAGQVRDAMIATLGGDPSAATLVKITTTGDRIQDRSLMELGGKALFTKEIEEALLEGRIDCAIHSLKDMPAQSAPGLVIGAIPTREDPRDAFLSRDFASLAALPQGARLGTSSLRRQAQSLHLRPDLAVVMMRGNVDTRLGKLEAGEADAILLAMSGLNRLGLGHLPKALIDPELSPPAPGQGALAIQVREGDTDAPWLADLRDAATTLAVTAERGALEVLEGSCRTAIGAYARLDGGRLTLIVEALTPDGSRRFRRQGEAEVSGPSGLSLGRDLGRRLGEEIGIEGGADLLASFG